MKLQDLVKDITAKTITLTWEKMPSEATQFEVSFTLDDRVGDYKVLGYTVNPVFTDTWNYDKAILTHRVNYKINALAEDGMILDTLWCSSDTIPSTLLQRTMNILKHKAAIILKNSQWSGEVHILKKRVNGKHCSKCYSRDLKASSNPDCLECYGTGFVGGYYDPIPSFLLPLSEQIKNSQINETVSTSFDLLRGTMPSFPKAREKDYIYIVNEGWFQVTGTTASAILSKKTPTQVIDLTLLDPKDPIYRFPLATKLSKVSSVSVQINEGSVKVMGERLVPVFGETKMMVWDSEGKEYVVYHGTDLRKVSDKELLFKSDKGSPPVIARYRLHLNGLTFTGLVSH